MLEVFFIVVVVVLFPFVSSVFGKAALFLLLLVFVLPGMYSTIKGAPYLPTGEKRLKSMLDLAALTSEDRVVDLGCGDGKVIAAVSDYGVKEAIGYEFSVPTFLVAKFRKFLRKGNEKIVFGNFWKKKFDDFDVVVCFLLEKTMLDFEKNIWPTLKKGTRVVSNEFKMKAVSPDREEGRVYLYVKK